MSISVESKLDQGDAREDGYKYLGPEYCREIEVSAPGVQAVHNHRERGTRGWK
jgi:hypothetical protein